MRFSSQLSAVRDGRYGNGRSERRTPGARARGSASLLRSIPRAAGARGDGSDGQLAVVRADAGGDGPPVVAGGCGGDPAVGGAATEDGQARRAAYFDLAVRRKISTDMGAERGDARCASVAASPAEAGGDAVAGEEPAAASGVEPGRASARKIVEPGRPCGASRSAAERMDSPTSQRVAGDAGAVRPASGGERSRGESGSGATAGSAAVDDASGRRASSGTSVCAHDRTPFSLPSREAGGQLSGTDSAGEIFGWASEAGLD